MPLDANRNKSTSRENAATTAKIRSRPRFAGEFFAPRVKSVLDLPTTFPACRCEKCISGCRSLPGLFTPAQAIQAIDAGLSDRLMAVGYDDERGIYRCLAPLTIPKNGYHPTAITPHLRLE